MLMVNNQKLYLSQKDLRHFYNPKINLKNYFRDALWDLLIT